MTPSNGHANSGPTAPVDNAQNVAGVGPASLMRPPNGLAGFTPEEIRRYAAELEIPFDPRLIEWRVTNTSQDKARGQVIPYSDQRAYTDRLNALFTPAGWTRKYTIHTSANFERSKDQKIVAKSW